MLDKTHLQILLQAYAKGDQLRAQIADNIVAEFRPFLKKDNGPNYDGPLYARLMDALGAAESYGRADLFRGSTITVTEEAE